MPQKISRTTFIYKPMPHFVRKLTQVQGDDPAGHIRINKVIERLLNAPENADGKMRGFYNGRYKKYVGRKDYRLIYYWCRLCRKENRRLEQKCEGCDELPDNSVIFFDLYHKKDMKKFKEL